MKESVYSFSNSAGDKFYLRLAADCELFLSKDNYAADYGNYKKTTI